MKNSFRRSLGRSVAGLFVAMIGISACARQVNTSLSQGTPDADAPSVSDQDLAEQSLSASAILGNPTVGSKTDNGDSNYLDAVRFKMPNQAGTATSMSVYIASPISPAPNNLFQTAVYADAGGRPGTLLAKSDSQSIVGNAWNRVSIGGELSPNATYWLAYNTNGTSASANNMRLAPGGTGQIQSKPQVFGAWPTTFGTPAGGGDLTASIYLRYTPSPAPSSSPSPSPAPVVAANRFVSPSGNDANPGTQSLPWKTIQRAANTAVPGDVVSIAAGTYRETVTISASGTPSARITFSASGIVVIGGNLRIFGSYITVNGITSSPPSAGGFNAITIAGQHNVLSNCLVTNYGASAADQATAIGIEASGAYNLVQGCTIRDLSDIDVFHVFGHDNTVRDNYVTNIRQLNYNLNHTDFIQSWGWTGGMSYNILIEGNLVTNSTCQLGNLSNDGIANVRDWTFRNNIFANVSNALFSGIPNTSYYNNLFYNVGDGQGYALSLYTTTGYSSAGDRIVNNVFLNDIEDIHFHDSAARTGMGLVSNNFFGGENYTPKTNGEFMGSNFINGGNPNFVNPSSMDFHLTLGSVLINRGMALAPAFPDLDGITRPQAGAWDIGPYEHH